MFGKLAGKIGKNFLGNLDKNEQQEVDALGQATGVAKKISYVAMLAPILFPFILIVLVIMIFFNQTQGMEGIANVGSAGCQRRSEEKWAEFFNSEAEGTSFYNKINDLVEDNPGIDINLVSAILTFHSDISVEKDYKCNLGKVDEETGEIIKEECVETNKGSSENTRELYNEAKTIVAGMMSNGSVKSDEEIKSWLQNSYLEGRLRRLNYDLPSDEENKKDIISRKVEEIYFTKDLYETMVCKEDAVSSGITSCSYQVRGKKVEDVQVEVLSCDGSQVEFTVDFEKYVKGVVFAENRGAPDESIKAQAVVARSFALMRQTSMCPGRPDDCEFGYNPEKNVIRMRGCENDQVYCDPDQGCTIEQVQNLDYGTVRIWKQGNTGNGQYIAPLTGKAKERFDSLVDSVSGVVLVDQNNEVFFTNFTNDDQNAWSAMANLGKKYDQILLEHYKNKGQTGKTPTALATSCASTGEILPGINFPIAEKFYSPNCYSAGEYYPGGIYHGSIDFAHTSLFGSKIPLSAPVKIVSSTDGEVIIVGTGIANTYPSCFNGGAKGGQGYYIKIDDKGSKYNGYTIAYWHLDTLNPDLKVGSKVKKGDFLGTMGNTGCSTGKHLHWQLISPTGTNIITDDAVTNYCKQNYTKE